MSTKQSKFSEASNWFSELAKFAGTVKRAYSKANRQAVTTRKQFKKAIQLALRADRDAYELVGDVCDTPVLNPEDKEAQLKFWMSWVAEVFNEAYSEEFAPKPKKDDVDEE